MKDYIATANFIDFRLGSVSRKAKLTLGQDDAERLLPLGVLKPAAEEQAQEPTQEQAKESTQEQPQEVADVQPPSRKAARQQKA